MSDDARRILVLQHIDCEPPAAYGAELAGRGIPVDTVELDAGEPLPDWRPYAGIVAMGGPMGAYDDEALPWLAGEKRAIEQAVRSGAPFWGVCLGAQLLAASLGAPVYRGSAPEVGVLPVSLTRDAAADPVLSAAPASFEALQWHGDTYDLPAGAVRLAGSELYEQQAFVFDRAYALQFHIEVDAPLLAQWGAVPAYAGSLAALDGDDPLGALLTQLAGAQEESIALARLLFSRWLELVAGFPPAGS
jgi:GMP synthase-like glutamine amidotransferase